MSHNKLVVLMLGGARRVSMAELLKRSGKRLGYEIEIVSYELNEKVPIAIAGKVIVGLRWNDPDVVSDIIRVVKEYDVRIVLPFVDGSIEIASRLRDMLPEVFIPVSDFELSKAMFDKVEAARMFKEADIPIPLTYSVISAEMPAIAKPRHGSSSRGIKIFHNIEDLMHLENLNDYLVQEYIEDNSEYTVDCYVDRSGKPMVIVPRKRLEVMGGEVTRTETCRIEELHQLSHRILETFPLRGPVTLQFLHDRTQDRYLLMEINPRLGGGVICSIYAGAPFPDYIIKEALGITIAPCLDWIDKTLMARYQKEAIFFGE